MRKFKLSQLLAGLFLSISIACLSPSCATANQSKVDAQRKALMMQDKSDFSRNQKHFKGSKAYKKQLKRNRKHRKHRSRH